MAYRRLEEHVGLFSDYLREQAETPEGQELLAAKFMGRWRSGAPLVLAPERRRSRVRRGPHAQQRLQLQGDGPARLRVPLGSHARRLNPRDTAENMNRRRMIRRGATYGPALPEGAPDDGVDRGIAAFIICASLVRQFEFAQNVWINDLPSMNSATNATRSSAPRTAPGIHDPEPADPQSPQGTAGLHHPQGRRLLLPAGHQCAALPGRARQKRERHEHADAGAHLQPDPRPAKHNGQPAGQHLLDVELSVGSPT